MVGTAMATIIAGLAGAGASVAGAKMASGAQKDAAKTQAESADKALAVSKQMHEQERADLGPYRSAGQGAVSALARGLDVEGYPDTTIPGASSVPGQAPAVNSGTVKLRAPTGQIADVPADRVDAYLARGAQRVA